jgi:hypothetical protein
MKNRILCFSILLTTTNLLYCQKSNIVTNYIDPSSTENFKTKNECVATKDFANALVCSKKVNDISYKVFLSLDAEVLKKIQTKLQPSENEIYYFFQQFENRSYDFNKEERPDKFMAFSIPAKLKQNFKQKKIDDLQVIEVLEHKFWNVSDFSGMMAYKYLEEEIDK